ncbi:hypothetical protein L1987_49182 [Smallanthus sonchifolius]|uniref:Uncharacterized protein n=1 Tax=Smallanthus sonchifolius TaxID=185202 RepID=A0ACB9FTF2_9ASTR|nr:hypothetical protein L1987_49182 [Smallanthus sonchifolius]
MSRPNQNLFLSVQNSKTTTADVAKNRMVAKTLVFNSSKKAIVLKKSVELHTPLTKICEGMKRLEIASQKKTLKGSISKPKKPEPEDSSRKLKICKNEKKDLAPSKSTKTQNKKTPTYKCNSLHDQVVDVKEENLQPQETSDTSNSHALRAEMNELSNLGSHEDHSNVDDKENALNPQDNNRSNNQPLGDKILSMEMHQKNKIVQTASPAVMKCKKPKPTNIKPFRLRTDEREILKEAILERKLHFTAPEKEVAKYTCAIKRTYRAPKNEKLSTSDNCGKVSVQTVCSVRMPGQQLGVIEEKSSKLTNDVKMVGNNTRAVSAARSTSRGKRHVTVAKEPNFHTSHLPRTCSKKTA